MSRTLAAAAGLIVALVSCNPKAADRSDETDPAGLPERAEDARREPRAVALPPLAPPTPRLLRLLAHPAFAWRSIDTRRGRIHYEADGYARDNLGVIAAGLEEAVDRALEVIGEPAYDRGIRLLVTDSRDDMEALIGIRPKGIAMAVDDTILLVFNERIRPYLRHEVFHIVSIRLWGEPPAWLREGSAFFADGRCLDYPDAADLLAAYLMRRQMLIPVADLVQGFDQHTRRNDMITYIESGSLFGYLLNTFGREAVKRMWSGEELVKLLGEWNSSLEEIEAGWLAHLSSVDPATTGTVDWAELMELGCG